MRVETSRDARILAVMALARLPLFQLSTAGMELFHTNMLYWFASERPDESIAVWNAFGLSQILVHDQVPFVRREWHHIDLVVAPGDDLPALVLENKIGAIPNPQQLDGYYAGLRSARPPFSIDASSFVLLTLTPPSFLPPKPWRSMTYRDLLPALRETARNLTGADASLVGAYVDTVARLDKLAAAYDPAGNLNVPCGLLPEEWHVLNEARLLSLVEKVRAGRFAEIVTSALAATPERTIPIETGFSNGSGIVQGFVAGPAERRFGWQIQGGTLRLAVITEEQDRRQVARQVALVAGLYEAFFDFALPDHLARLLGPYTGRKVWHSFAPSFVYQHRPLAPGVTWNDLLGLVTWFSRRAHEFAGSRQSDPSL